MNTQKRGLLWWFVWMVFILPGFCLQKLPAQVSSGGIPVSFSEVEAGKNAGIAAFNVNVPEISQLMREDSVDEGPGIPRRNAVLIPVDVTMESCGTWREIPGKGTIWQLKIEAKGAKAVGLYFSEFSLASGCTLHIYNESGNQLSGAFTDKNNRDGGFYAIGHLFGEHVIIEYFKPFGITAASEFRISDVAYFYRGVNDYINGRGFGDSGPCEVNINCSPEGEGWKDEKKGIVRISCRVGSASFWCTGALVNNTGMDKTPYILTADHCAYKFFKYATPQDLEQWIFYFDFESPDCENPFQSPQLKSLTGAVKVASGGDHGTDGSDFYLVKLQQEIPSGYNVYFNGWNALDIAAAEGVTIHHPEGDIKKISTFSSPLISSGWQGNGLASHWQVTWSQTTNGYGVTEPGSSGSPLFDQAGRVIGTLTGGQASCNQPTLPDYYGKFSYHWSSNGTDDTLRLLPWLDPVNTGQMTLGGLELFIPDTMVKETAFIEVLPNPAHSTLYLKRLDSLHSDIVVEVYDITGRQVKEINVSGLHQGEAYPLDISLCSKGMHFVRIIEENGISLHKIIF
ncbi:MAG: T9SS type A sorting domain-containing protein, partial [Bacteroidales bacterium]|nr:T9SS type A sorting domain-containing protein [Bacteroidales bacterium]